MPFIFEIVFGSLLLATAILLFIGIIRARQDHRFFRRAIPLTAAILSLSWIAAALIWRGALGPDYSALRVTIAGVNMLCMTTAAIIAASVKSQRSWPTVPAALILACIWLYIGAITYAV